MYIAITMYNGQQLQEKSRQHSARKTSKYLFLCDQEKTFKKNLHKKEYRHIRPPPQMSDKAKWKELKKKIGQLAKTASKEGRLAYGNEYR